jgi:predicted alpha/beta hydrolase
LISAATGVKQHFYMRFATWLAQQGRDVLVFDYRGVGMSRQGKLKEDRSTLLQWGQQDQVAALEWLCQRTGSEQLVLVGNSAGGQMLGLLPNHARVARLVGVASSSGWFQVMAPVFRFKARLGLRILMPLCVRVLGYAPTSKIGLGEDLPAGVALQWGQWCAAGGYAMNAIRNAPDADYHAQIRILITALYAEDDDIANAATVNDLMRTFPHAEKRVVPVSPASVGLKTIGHLDWFRSSHRVVWPLIFRAIGGEEVIEVN